MNKLPEDPRLPMPGIMDYDRALYSRLYELFRTIAVVVNSGGGGVTTGLVIKGAYSTLGDLVAGVPDPTVGDTYTVGDYLYVWDGGTWFNAGTFRGPPGDPGLRGPSGWSAYEVALNNGFSGTEPMWLISLKGDKGEPGLRGLQGERGWSAYEVALNNGYVGTELQWLASIVGPQGPSAYDVAVAQGFVGTPSAWLASLKGPQGIPGPENSGPIFYVFRANNQPVTANTHNVVGFNDLRYIDPPDVFGNSRFNPRKPGYYYITAAITPTPGVRCIPMVAKNGVEHLRGNDIDSPAVYTLSVQGIVAMNGTTDYLEIFAYPLANVSLAGGATQTYMMGHYLRPFS